MESYAIKIKERFAKLQKMTNLAIILFVALGFGYYLFWLGAISDDIFLEYGKNIFEPLAKFLNGGDTSISIYSNTSLMLFGAIIPTIFLQYFLSKTEENLISENNLKVEKKLNKEKQEELRAFASRFDSIRTYSICLSLDWEDKKEVSKKNKETLNKAIFSKIGETLTKIEPNSNVAIGDVLIFVSRNFLSYDWVCDKLLKELSIIKAEIEKKYSFKLIPSMTTDAFSNDFAKTNIREQHFEIQTFNFKNRALTTATFANKYKHLNRKKYVGTPIGEYAYFKGGKMSSYELNVIHKNLANALTNSIKA